MTVYSLLQDDSNVSAITDNIYIGQAPQGSTAPYIVLNIININPDNKLSEAPTIDNEIISVNCYGESQKASITLFETCRDALQSSMHVQGVNVYGLRDPDVDIFRTQFDVSHWLNR